jgi:prophage regulatory protein
VSTFEMPVHLLRLPAVKQRTGLSRARIYQLIAVGQFPAQIKYGRSSLWPSNEIDEWVAKTIAVSRGAR